MKTFIYILVVSMTGLVLFFVLKENAFKADPKTLIQQTESLINPQAAVEKIDQKRNIELLIEKNRRGIVSKLENRRDLLIGYQKLYEHMGGNLLGFENVVNGPSFPFEQRQEIIHSLSLWRSILNELNGELAVQRDNLSFTEDQMVDWEKKYQDILSTDFDGTSTAFLSVQTLLQDQIQMFERLNGFVRRFDKVNQLLNAALKKFSSKEIVIENTFLKNFLLTCESSRLELVSLSKTFFANEEEIFKLYQESRLAGIVFLEESCPKEQCPNLELLNVNITIEEASINVPIEDLLTQWTDTMSGFISQNMIVNSAVN